MDARCSIFWHTRGDTGSSVRDELASLRNCGDSGATKDAGKLRAAINAWEEYGPDAVATLCFNCIEEPEFNGLLRVAHYPRSFRSDGVTGYRIYFANVTHPTLEGQTGVALLKLCADNGRNDTASEIDDAWQCAKEVFELLERDEFL